VPALIPTAPDLAVELYVGGSAFTLDDPTLGTLDAGNVLGPTADGWHPLTPNVISAAWRIGATHADGGPLTRMNPGAGVVDVWDPHRTYDPGNPLGPFRGRVGPPAPLRIVATDDAGTQYPQFVGTVASSTWGDGVTTFEATDAMSDLAAYDPPEGADVGAGETSGARVQRILTEAGYRHPVALSAGTVTVQGTGGLAQTALTSLYLVTDSELGALYVDRAGTLVYRDRTAWALRRPALYAIGPADFPGILTATRSGASGDGVANIIGAASAGNAESVVMNAQSVARWGQRRYARRDLLLQTPAQLAQWAADVLVWTKDERPAATEELVLWPQNRVSLWPFVLTLTPLTPVRLDLQAGAAPETPIVVGWAHAVTGTDWHVTLVLAPHPLDALTGSPFTVDHPTAGKLDAGNVVI
jgi:hypothetical protein